MGHYQADKNRQAEDRVRKLYEKAFQYKTKDPEISLGLARKVLEAICKNIYLRADLKTKKKDIEKMTLYPLFNELERVELLPQHIRMHLNTVKAFGDFSAHYQLKLAEDLTTEYVEPIFQTLKYVYNWYDSEYSSATSAEPIYEADKKESDQEPVTSSKPVISMQVRVIPHIIIMENSFEIRLLWENKGGVTACNLKWSLEYDQHAFKLIRCDQKYLKIKAFEVGVLREDIIEFEPLNIGEHIITINQISWEDDYGNEYELASYSIPVEVDFGWTKNLVGRDQEFTGLVKAVERAKNWQGSLITIKGEAGVGKSYLLEKVIKYARENGFLVLKESCEFLNETWAFHPFKKIFDTYFSLMGVNGIREKSDQMHSGLIELSADLKPYASILTQYFIGESKEEQRTPFQHSPQDLRGQFLFAAGQLFEAISSKQPTLLCIEDLQYADTGTIDLIQYLAKRTQGHPLLILSAVRSEDLISSRVEEAHPLERALREIIINKQGKVLKLGPLSSESCASLIRSIFEEALFPPEFSSIIFEETEGNPLYIHEILKSLVEREIIFRQTDGKWVLRREIDDLDIPDTIEQVIKNRLELVSKESFIDLQKASIIGREFAYQLLQQLSNRDEDILINYLEEFTDHRIIETYDHYGEIYRFCHGKIKEVVYKEIQAIRRRKLHIQAAELLENIYKNQLTEFSSIISQHYSYGGNYDKAVEYLLMSGWKNARVYANKEAVTNYQEALVLNSKRNQSLETIKTEQDINFNLALVYREMNDYGLAYQYYDKALAIAEKFDDQVSIAKIINKQAETYAIRGDYDQAEQLYQKCLHIADTLKLNELQLQLYNDFADLYWWKCHGLLFQRKKELVSEYMKKIFDYTTKARSKSEELGDYESLVRSCKNIGNYYYLLGNNEEALEQFEFCIELAESQNLLSQKYVYEMAGRVYRQMGFFDKALGAYQKYLSWSLKIGAQWAKLKAYQVMGLVSLELQEYEDALNWLEKSIEINRVVQGYHENIETLIIKGQVLEAIGEQKKGFDCYLEALENRGIKVDLDKSQQIYKYIGIEMFSRQEKHQAKRFIQRYLDCYPELAEAEEELIKEIML